MVKVFLSSVATGLEASRDAVFAAVMGLHDHHCVRMEDFGAVDQQPEAFCIEKVRECDIFVAVVGHRYGSSPPGDVRSFSEREYDAAEAAGKPCLIFVASERFPLPANLVEPDELRRRQADFRTRVLRDRVDAHFQSHEELATKVVSALHNEFISRHPRTERNVETRLLFPFVTNLQGFDTGIAIANTTRDNLTHYEQAGLCTIRFLGAGGTQRTVEVNAPIWPGEMVFFTLSGGGNYGVPAIPGFQGYMIVDCDFRGASGVAYLCAQGGLPHDGVGTCYVAQVVSQQT